MKIRKLTEEDWDTLVSWWDGWPEWQAPARDFLPGNGTSGFMIEKDDKPIVAGFVYITNSKAVFLEWVISNPEYREDDRNTAITCLISTMEKIIKDWGYKYIFSIGRTKSLIEKHKKLGWIVDEKPSHELLKKIN
jgi:hypothetical protein